MRHWTCGRFHNGRADYWAGDDIKSSMTPEIAAARNNLRKTMKDDLAVRTAATRVLRSIMDEFPVGDFHLACVPKP